MLPFGIGFSEIILVFLVLIIFVGPEGIPQAVRAIAKVIRAVRSMVDEVRYSEEFDEVKREILQPLEEARRFNPKRQAEDWVRREIEEPVQKLTREHVSDFKTAIEKDEPSQDVSRPKANESKGEIASSTDVETTLKENISQEPVNQLTDQLLNEMNDNEEDEEDEDEEETYAVAALDPLDRGIISEPQNLEVANKVESDQATKSEVGGET